VSRPRIKRSAARRAERSRRDLLRRLISLFVLLALAVLIIRGPLAGRGVTGGVVTFCLGVVLLFGYYLAKILASAKFPLITGYIIVGILCGPFVLNILSHETLASLQRLDNVALALIALIAGGELRLSTLRARARAFCAIIFAQSLFSMVVAVAVAFFLFDRVGVTVERDAGVVVAVGLLLGLVVIARSPATTIGVVTEMRSKGTMTELLVGVTVLLDVVLLLLAAIIIPASEVLAGVASFSTEFAVHLAIEVVGSVAAGLFFGVLLRVYIQWIRGYLALFLVGLGLIGSEVCQLYHLSPLLAFMIAGFFVENTSSLGPKLIKGLERSAFPVFVLFFSISGASIDLGALRSMWIVAVVLVLVRFAAFYVGSFSAARIASELHRYRHTIWSGYLSQAGVTIGIAAIIAQRFEWGARIETIALAVVAINQLVGPVALKILLVRSGEAGAMDR